MADVTHEVKGEVKGEIKTDAQVKYDYQVKDNPYSMGNALRSVLLFGVIVLALSAMGLFV